MKELVKQVVPASVYRPIRRAWWRLRRRPAPVGLSGLTPISSLWGLDRGTPIDHYYLERFISQHAADIRGRTLEMADSRYATKFGGDRLERSEVLHYIPGNPAATLVGDLVTGVGIPTGAFDCMIVVNTFLLIYDVCAAVATCHRALREGGVLLGHFTALASGVPTSPAWEGDYWRFTSSSAARVCADVFGPRNVALTVYGNVRTAAASLYGLAAEDLTAEELSHRDPRYEVVIGVRAVKRGPSAPP